MRVGRCIIALLAVLTLGTSPLFADEPVLPTTNVTHQEIVRAAVGATIENLPGGFLAVLYPASTSPQTIFEMRHGGSYNQSAHLYAPQPRQKGYLSRVVLLHYRTEDTDLAHRVTRLVARLLRLSRENFHRDTAFPRAAAQTEIWLNAPRKSFTHNAGGETWTNHVYLFQTQAERSPIEWVRTVVHEWGHLTLPAARGYTEPETDAAGFLGERLFFKWLYEDEMRDGDDLVRREDMALYYKRQVAPLIEQYQESGPGSPLLRKLDTEGMDYYIGGVLAADDAFGPTAVGRALFSIESERAIEFNRTMRETLENSASFEVTLPAWVPLELGTYQITAKEANSLLIADRPPFPLLRGDQTFDVRLGGWKWLRTADNKPAKLIFRLTRSGRPE